MFRTYSHSSTLTTLALALALSACVHDQANLREESLDDTIETTGAIELPVEAKTTVADSQATSDAPTNPQIDTTSRGPEPEPVIVTQSEPIQQELSGQVDYRDTFADKSVVEYDFEGVEENDEMLLAPPMNPNSVLFGNLGEGSRASGTVGAKGSSSIGGLAKRSEGRSSRAGGVAGFAASAPPVVATPTPNTEHYTDYGVNRHVDPTKDPLSTFSIDVDTASFALSRNKLESGALPDWRAVRVEEFINYGTYDYVSPTDDPFSVDMELMPSPFQPGHHLLRVGVQGETVDRDTRDPIHLTFLVDVSGSMSRPEKLGLAKTSLHKLVKNLREDDTVALCTYAGRVARILEPTTVGDAQRIHTAIDQLSAGGSTAMSSGIDLAYDMAWKAFQTGHENRVIVLSDGDANVGRTSWQDMLTQIKSYADKGVTLTTVGFGQGNYKDTTMEQLANKGDGTNFYIDGERQAQRVFVDQIGGTLVTIARDVKIQVEFDPDSVTSYRLVGYENRDIADKDFRNDRVDAGEVGAGHSVTALYDLVLASSPVESLATVRLRYEQPGPDSEATEKAWGLARSAFQDSSDDASKDTRIAYARATFAEILRNSPHVAEVSLEDLAELAEDARRRGKDEDRELVELILRAHTLREGGTLSGPMTW
ncbi:MAG: von Willebrand factor type A domain-containing protein [Myxococcota bacterium]|nr:von Willebrand factor type A domain-containing protein [Myxococcota bacterium]